MVDNIADATAHLQSLLLKKGEELKEREENFERRLRLYEKENPMTGSDTDVLQLNVGGNTNIAVLRRTLTYFGDSYLAVKFSGRWDEQLEKDRDGNFFIDQDPEIFLLLIGFLRRCDQRVGDIPVRRPPVSHNFCWMLEYYNLMPALYPQKWDCIDGNLTVEEESYGTLVLSTKSPDSATGSATALCRMGDFFGCGVSEFTVKFEKGSLGCVGWYEFSKENNTRIENQALPDPASSNSMFFDVAKRKINAPNGNSEENIKIDNLESDIEVICRYGEGQKYSIEVVGANSPDGFGAILPQQTGAYERPTPLVSFSGKLTISELRYAIHHL